MWTSEHLQQAHDRWLELASALECHEAAADGVWEALRLAYCDAGRQYHHIGHIADLLRLTAQNSARLASPVIVDLAVFFHDAVYVPTRSDNEHQSAVLARDRLLSLGQAPECVEKVVQLIEATAHGDIPKVRATGDLAWFLDFDLSVLAADRERYEQYVGEIRREFSIYPDALYRRGRVKVLRSLIERTRIFATDHYCEVHEPLARANLAWELDVLACGRLPG